uniref:Uncharacterized protein n=1 Tax=Hyaloperonospora arabidopsidis (strain Emoy2) TaxID=559515 RepID=M4BXA8_HYAAE
MLARSRFYGIEDCTVEKLQVSHPGPAKFVLTISGLTRPSFERKKSTDHCRASSLLANGTTVR